MRSWHVILRYMYVYVHLEHVCNVCICETLMRSMVCVCGYVCVRARFIYTHGASMLECACIYAEVCMDVQLGVCVCVSHRMQVRVNIDTLMHI